MDGGIHIVWFLFTSDNTHVHNGTNWFLFRTKLQFYEDHDRNKILTWSNGYKLVSYFEQNSIFIKITSITRENYFHFSRTFFLNLLPEHFQNLNTLNTIPGQDSSRKYQKLFEIIRTICNFTINYITFENFKIFQSYFIYFIMFSSARKPLL